MKLLLATILSTALLAASANAQIREEGRVPDRFGPYTNGANAPVSSGERTAPPNTPRAYGETNSGRRVNPDRVPPLSPGGQGLGPESR
jgi:hypothetical protein